MSRNTCIELSLTPYRSDDYKRDKTFIEPGDWTVVLDVGRKYGFSPPGFRGLARSETKDLRHALARALAEGQVPDDRKPLVERVVRFLETGGACGFMVERRWRRAI